MWANIKHVQNESIYYKHRKNFWCSLTCWWILLRVVELYDFLKMEPVPRYLFSWIVKNTMGFNKASHLKSTSGLRWNFWTSRKKFAKKRRPGSGATDDQHFYGKWLRYWCVYFLNSNNIRRIMAVSPGRWLLVVGAFFMVRWFWMIYWLLSDDWRSFDGPFCALVIQSKLPDKKTQRGAYHSKNSVRDFCDFKIPRFFWEIFWRIFKGFLKIFKGFLKSFWNF